MSTFGKGTRRPPPAHRCYAVARGRQGRTLRGVGAARTLCGRASCRVQIIFERHNDPHRAESRTPAARRERTRRADTTQEAAMSTTAIRSDATTDARVGKVDMKLEVVVIPVSDVGRAAEFYRRLGWRVDTDIAKGDGRLLQFTPPGSPCSIIFGTGVTPSAPGTARFLHLIVSHIEAARNE